MKYFVTALVVVVMVAGASVAGLNPDCKVFVTFDGDAEDYLDCENGARVDPTAFTAGTVYFGMLDYASWTTISIKMEIDDGVSSPASYTSLLPGGLSIGSWESGDGITLSSTRPITPGVDGPFMFFASASVFYLGAAGEVKIIDHVGYPRWVVDSESEVDYYCVWTNGGVLMDPTPVEPGCFGDTPVEEQTWGAIKALYR